MPPLKSNKPVRYSVSFRGDSPEDTDNFVSYSTELDKRTKLPTAFSHAVFAASKYLGKMVAVFADGSWEMVRDYTDY